MGTQPIDYDALAKQAGALSSKPANVDYDALAKQAGAISSAPEEQGGFWSALKEDLGNLAKSLPVMAAGPIAAPYIGIRKAIDEYRAGKETGKTTEAQHYEEQKQAGYGLGYRLATPIAEGLGANVSGMEAAAAKGDTGAVLGHTVVPVALAASPLAVEGAGRVAGAAAKAGGEASIAAAERIYKSPLKPNVASYSLSEVKERVATALKGGIPISAEGIQKLSGLTTGVQNAVKQQIEAGGKPGATISREAVSQRLAETQQKFATQVAPAEDLKAIAKAGEQFTATQPEQIPVQQAQALKVGTYQQLKGKYGELSAARIEAEKALARGIREELEAVFPEIGALNAQEAKFIGLDQVLERAVRRTENRDIFSLGGKIAIGSGGIIGAAAGGAEGAGVGAMATGLLHHVLTNPELQSRLAIGLYKVGKRLNPSAAEALQATSSLSRNPETGQMVRMPPQPPPETPSTPTGGVPGAETPIPATSGAEVPQPPVAAAPAAPEPPSALQVALKARQSAGLVLNYLKNSDKYAPTAEAKAIGFIQKNLGIDISKGENLAEAEAGLKLLASGKKAKGTSPKAATETPMVNPYEIQRKAVPEAQSSAPVPAATSSAVAAPASETAPEPKALVAPEPIGAAPAAETKTATSETIRDRLAGKDSMMVGTVTQGADHFKISLRPDTSESGRYSVVAHSPRGTQSFRMQYKAGTPLAEALRDFEEYLNIDNAGEKFRVEAAEAKASPSKTEAIGPDMADHAELKRLQAIRFKGAGQEKQIELLKKRIAADPAKWKAGDGVGWKVTGNQINRGFRIAEVDPQTKTAVIRQVADTGITSTGGDYDRIQDQRVHIAYLVRDNKYNAIPPSVAPEKLAASRAKVEAQPQAAEWLLSWVGERQAILNRIGAADTTFDFRRPKDSGPTPGSIRDELHAFDEAHPEVAAEMKRQRKARYKE